jgi:hypothetical protein
MNPFIIFALILSLSLVAAVIGLMRTASREERGLEANPFEGVKK